MAVKDIFKVSRQTFFSPSKWLGFTDLKNNTIAIYTLLKGLFQMPPAARKETFAEAKARLKLTENDIKETEQSYLFNALLYLGCAVIAVFGGVYLLIEHRTLAGLILALCTAAIFGAQAFRNHFLYFQIKVRKLGCTYAEWKKFTLKSLGVGKA